ncbi:hypothetical protein DQW50_16600 [Halorubrum sp. 48-1-W]|uniref:hypothetical protein n=1 Tax=Halorubrum sp. 48-1-W TaxID=2249761 RepID=UPI000DCCA89B|nr:hypothetical protein [Halorubrum sp. 48-1-W]RAW44025.1 hypothetical protein DQW50_16600 [Halorubrum sp. 48-1-W]
MTLEGTAEHAVASAGMHGAATADDIDGGFSDEDIKAWMETAVDPIESEIGEDDEEHNPE